MKKNLILLLLLQQVFNVAFAQKFVYKKIAAKHNFMPFEQVEERNSFFDLTSKLEDNPSLDQTDVLQQYFNKYRKIKMPNFPVLVNHKGLRVPSNTTIYFDEKSEIQMKGNNKERYCVLCITNVNNVTLYNPNIKGDRKSHTGNKGEWGMGIDIKSAVNVRVYNANVRDCWGDGIYIGFNKHVLSSNIKIVGGVADYNRRNGLSIVSGRDIVVENFSATNTYGAKPMAGIDIEPNGNSVEVSNIALRNIYTANNYNEGILLYLVNLNHMYKKKTSISIDDHLDEGSAIGVRVSSMNKGNAHGDIEIKNSKWLNNAKYPLKWGDLEKVNIKVLSSSNKADGKNIDKSTIRKKVEKVGEKYSESKNVIFK